LLTALQINHSLKKLGVDVSADSGDDEKEEKAPQKKNKKTKAMPEAKANFESTSGEE
jgi:hypothetical protein